MEILQMQMLSLKISLAILSAAREIIFVDDGCPQGHDGCKCYEIFTLKNSIQQWKCIGPNIVSLTVSSDYVRPYVIKTYANPMK